MVFKRNISKNSWKKFSDFIWYILDSDIPYEIIKLESKNIKIEGFLSDEDLNLLYQRCSISIDPLLFGIGIKDKIVEAAYNQIPIVTTT